MIWWAFHVSYKMIDYLNSVWFIFLKLFLILRQFDCLASHLWTKDFQPLQMLAILSSTFEKYFTYFFPKKIMDLKVVNLANLKQSTGYIKQKKNKRWYSLLWTLGWRCSLRSTLGGKYNLSHTRLTPQIICWKCEFAIRQVRSDKQLHLSKSIITNFTEVHKWWKTAKKATICRNQISNKRWQMIDSKKLN